MSFFNYPSKPHVRSHGPAGYADYKAYKPWLRDEFIFRCVYCLVREIWYPNGAASFSVDHFIPQVNAPDKVCDYDNLLYACSRCNSSKQDADVINPCQEAMSKHLLINEDGTIRAMTPEAVDHVRILHLDDPELIEYRAHWIRTLKRLADLPDAKSKALLRYWLGFPKDLPNLTALRPPGGNTRPGGAKTCYYKQRQAGTLPEVY
ncbi:MAG: HNH endonuclease [Acidobacteriota bacterium]|nr:HNH endonuclease [Acidobacteriota bacterium]